MKDLCRHIFFDLDHTLWDFDKNAEETLHELFNTYQLQDYGLASADIFIETYTRNNHQLWVDYHLGRISKTHLRETRFKKTFLDLGLDEANIPENFEEDYVNICPTKTNLFPGVHKVLSYLREKYTLHLISNGFRESTEYKIHNNDLGKYFGQIIISEVVGVNKPDPAIFQFALRQACCQVGESLMVGDSLEADIRGARDFGMQTLWFNPHFAERPRDVAAEINHLEELLNLL